MTADRPAWTVTGIEDHWGPWRAEQLGDDALHYRVHDWIRELGENPYPPYAKREPGLGNYWYAQIPQTIRYGHAVICCWWVYEADRAVVVDQLAWLPLPII